MPDYRSPGVYFEEVDKSKGPIEAVGTAVAAFIGYTVKAERSEPVLDSRNQPVIDEKTGQPKVNRTDLRGVPTLVTNWSQYKQQFGEFAGGIYLPDAVYGYFLNGGGRCYIVSIKALEPVPDEDEFETAAEPTPLVIPGTDRRPLLKFLPKGYVTQPTEIEIETDALNAPENGRGRVHTFRLVIRRPGSSTEAFEGLTLGQVETMLKARSQLVEVELVPTPLANVVPVSGSYVLEGLSLDDSQITVKDYQGDLTKRRGLGGLEPIEEITMICVPDLMSSYEAGEIDLMGVRAVQDAVITYCERVRYCFAILDSPPKMMPQQVAKWRMDNGYDSSRAALYYPWIKVADQTGSNGRVRTIPPCGHIAGIYARNDETRGVHKAPANEVIRGTLDLAVQVTKGEQDGLNPIGVNVIRAFPGRGIRVWGARTLSSDPAWRYVNVRRLFNMVERSIENGTQWVVFEPNDPALWARVRRDVSAFLKLVWRQGALFGTTAEQAYYVKCDEELNPPEVRDTGRLYVEIGICPVKPAEFVVFRISQWSGPNGE